MRTGDKQYQHMLREASKYTYNDYCAICMRHVVGQHELKYLNPHNLLQHMKATHGYSILPKPKRWWQIWR